MYTNVPFEGAFPVSILCVPKKKGSRMVEGAWGKGLLSFTFFFSFNWHHYTAGESRKPGLWPICLFHHILQFLFISVKEPLMHSPTHFWFWLRAGACTLLCLHIDKQTYKAVLIRVVVFCCNMRKRGVLLHKEGQHRAKKSRLKTEDPNGKLPFLSSPSWEEEKERSEK